MSLSLCFLYEMKVIYLFPLWSPYDVFLRPDLLVWFWAELEEEASRPEKDSKTLSSDLIEYVQYMIREHKDNYKVSAGNIRLAY